MSASIRCDELHLDNSKSNRVVLFGVFSNVSVEGSYAMVGFTFVKKSVMVSTAAIDSALLSMVALSDLMIGSEALKTEVSIRNELYLSRDVQLLEVIALVESVLAIAPNTRPSGCKF